MGLFSKKEYVCEKCGKTFIKRINLNGNLCEECYKNDVAEREQLTSTIKGYVNWRRDASFAAEDYTFDELKKIIEHRDALLEKFQNEDGIDRTTLMCASDNYKKLTDDEITAVLSGVFDSMVSTTLGAGYTDSFFVPTGYENVIVDAEDVFAVTMTTDHKKNYESGEVILCAVFTNDPYIPVFPMEFIGKTGLFEIVKSKKGRESVAARFESMCPNLKYPVCDTKQLRKQLKRDGVVNGTPSMEFMLGMLDKAEGSSGIFKSKEFTHILPRETATMLDGIGYIQEEEINAILKMDKMLNRNFWNKQIEKRTK